MGTRLEYHIDVPPGLRCAPFPPMMLISLVENAIKHGVDPCCECGSITVHAAERDGRLVVSVIDTGEGIVAKEGGGLGLTNIRERLKALHGSDARLLLLENSPHGVVATIEVPAPAVGDAAPGDPRQAKAA
jgi:LytS/YehU family sensor histidine kinase